MATTTGWCGTPIEMYGIVNAHIVEVNFEKQTNKKQTVIVSQHLTVWCSPSFKYLWEGQWHVFHHQVQDSEVVFDGVRNTWPLINIGDFIFYFCEACQNRLYSQVYVFPLQRLHHTNVKGQGLKSLNDGVSVHIYTFKDEQPQPTIILAKYWWVHKGQKH